eukprot:TRINITY_DN12336_c0_g1_i3.p1 TRINITY_DN12336_c0_g1~~TRINITY_DN12336_c0_g1_i3.p1  ORF type:complete len:396 (+),score=47.65 TRINITY_DN12336_c0_g1_i3:35-1189(+)
MRATCGIFLICFLASLQLATCHIYSLRVTNDARRVIDLGAFGLGKGGVMQLEIKSLTVSDPVAEKSNKNIGFTLDWVKTALTARHEKNYAKGEGARRGRCFIDDSQVQPNEPPPDWRKVYPLEDKLAQSSPVVQSYEKHTITTPGMYALFFYNCKKLDSNATEQQTVPVSFEVTVTLYNIDAKGNISYLSYGKTILPEMYACFTVLFLSCLGGWIFMCVNYSQDVIRIHHVMTSLLILKILSLFCYSMKELWVQHGGQVTAWNYLYHTFLMLKGIMLFAVILLIGTGWSLFHQYLSERDKRTLAAIIPLQIMINVSIAVIQETSEGSPTWAFWRDSLLLFDVICCCVILLPIILSIKQVWASLPPPFFRYFIKNKKQLKSTIYS